MPAIGSTHLFCTWGVVTVSIISDTESAANTTAADDEESSPSPQLPSPASGEAVTAFLSLLLYQSYNSHGQFSSSRATRRDKELSSKIQFHQEINHKVLGAMSNYRSGSGLLSHLHFGIG